MKPSRATSRARKAAPRRTDPVQAKLLAAIACVFGAGAFILPLPLGLAGILLAGWGIWRHGRTGFGVVVFAGIAALTAAGILAGTAL
ncbi:MAG TPA: hypothetical protein VIF14_04405 [Alphaproteobacteria bacterium]|jgi:hypothetical protein